MPWRKTTKIPSPIVRVCIASPSYSTDATTIFPAFINVEKLRNIWKIVAQLKQAREEEYRLRSNAVLLAYLRDFRPATEDEVYEISLKCEARRPAP